MRIVLSRRVLWIAALALSLCATPTLAQDRTLQLSGVKNTRDLGGLSTADGRRVRPGRVFRSGEIDHIDASGKDRLEELGVAAIIDLRTTREATRAPARWPAGSGPARYNFPLLENESDLIDTMREKLRSGTAEAEWMERTFRDSFGTVATDYTEDLRKVFDVLLADAGEAPVLVHCSGGKDRTGVVTALFLTALGVPRDQIEADFLFSNIAVDADRRAERMAQTINEAQGTAMTAAAVWPSLGVRPEYLAHFYDTVELKYGSVDGFLSDALGLSQDDVENLRRKYLH